MDHFFQYDSQEDILWFGEALPVNQSAFVKYADLPIDGIGRKALRNDRNIHKSMMEFLMRTPSKETQIGRGYQHMLSERMRREKQRQSRLALQELLPPGTKNDQNSIMQMAAKEVKDLERCKEELERRNHQIEEVLAETEGEEGEKAKIRLRVAYPASGVDSMVEVLKCLKATGSKIKAIQSTFSAQELFAVLEVETKIGAAEAEKAVHRSLAEVERKFRNTSGF